MLDILHYINTESVLLFPPWNNLPPLFHDKWNVFDWLQTQFGGDEEKKLNDLIEKQNKNLNTEAAHFQKI